MKKFLTLVLGSTALMGVSMMGAAQAESDYPFAATGYVGGGGSWLSPDNDGDDDDDDDIATIIAGGDIVLPLSGYWNVQLGGGFHVDHIHFSRGKSDAATQFQGGVIGFWRDPMTGVFGIEAGLFSPTGNEGSSRRKAQNSVKIGGVAEYFFSDMVTFGAFGGALIPLDSNPELPVINNNKAIGKALDYDTGYYAGGHLTYYASDTLAFAGFARFTELNDSGNFGGGDESTSKRSILVGGKVRYLTSMPGVEVYALGGYHKCEIEFDNPEGGNTFHEDGAQLMGGVKIRLGGHTDSLVGIDRSNAIDTRAWACLETRR